MCLCGCEAVYQNKGYCYINLAPMFRIYKYQYTDMSYVHSDKIN